MLRTASSLPLTGLLTLGSDPARFPAKPPACYRASWQLPGPDFHRQATTSLRTRRNTMALRHGVTSRSAGRTRKPQYIVDGTLLPCWSWAAHPELYSGKHKTTGMNVQVACTIYGRLAWISNPVNGSRHDNYCLGESGALQTLDPMNWVADKGYVGNGMITPFKKPAASYSAGRKSSTPRSTRSAGLSSR